MYDLRPLPLGSKETDASGEEAEEDPTQSYLRELSWRRARSETQTLDCWARKTEEEAKERRWREEREEELEMARLKAQRQ